MKFVFRQAQNPAGHSPPELNFLEESEIPWPEVPITRDLVGFRRRMGSTVPSLRRDKAIRPE